MSLYQIAKNHCSNHKSDDCLLNDLPCKICNNLPCQTFRTVVWKEIDPSYKFSHDHKLYKQNIDEFNKVFNITETTQVRRCGCGALLKKRHRLCDSCASKNRRASYRNSKCKKVG